MLYELLSLLNFEKADKREILFSKTKKEGKNHVWNATESVGRRLYIFKLNFLDTLINLVINRSRLWSTMFKCFDLLFFLTPPVTDKKKESHKKEKASQMLAETLSEYFLFCCTV